MIFSSWFHRLFQHRIARPRDTVLVISEESLPSFLFGVALRSAGFDVMAEARVEDGILTHCLHHKEIALVVLNLPLTGMRLAHVLSALRVNDPGVRCLLTGTPEDSADQQLLARENNALLGRATTFADLSGVVALTRSAAQRV